MAKIPDNIVAILGVDNAGAITNIDPNLIFNTQVVTTPTAVAVESTKKEKAPEPVIITNTVESTIALTIAADPTNIPMVNKDQTDLENSIVWQTSKKIGINTKSPKWLLDLSGGSVNVIPVAAKDGYKLKSFNFAYGDFTTAGSEEIFMGDDSYLPIVNLKKLLIRGLTTTTSPTKIRILGINDTGIVSSFVMPTAGSVLFSDGVTLASDSNHFFWDDTNNRLGVLTNTPAYTLDINGIVRASTSLITPVIGNTAGITANNTWTFTSNINVPVTPTDPTHAASKQYVDNTALTGLKLGASVKTVATSNVGLSGLSAINGYTPIAGDRILVIGQTNATQNGVYDAASSGWTRSTDSDSDAELRSYQYLITAGTYINARYGNTNQSTISIGSTNITYQQISNAETDPIFTASPSFGITSTNITNWNTAYDRSAITLAISGTTTKTVTLTKQNGTTLSASFTDTITSVFNRTGDIVLTSSDVTTALGFTPYNATNPSGYTTNLGTVTSVGGTGTVSGLTLTGTVTTSGNLTLGGTLSLTSLNVTTALGFTPYNATNPNNYITIGDARGGLTLTTSGTSGAASYTSSTGVLNIPQYQSGVTSIIAGTGITISPTNGLGNVTISVSSSGTTPSLVQVCAVGSNASGYNITADAFFESSDIRLKTVLGENPDVDLSKLDVIKYLRTTHDKDKIRYGYSAQDLYDLCPDLVNKDLDGYLSVNYTDAHTLLILSLQKRIEELERKLNAN